VNGTRITFEFRVKSGKQHRVGLRHRRLAQVVCNCQELPGHSLFQYVDDAGERRPVNSEDVNTHMKEAMGEDFTAKDFRTWAGTLLAAAALANEPRPKSEAAGKQTITACVAAVAKVLGNTPAVCRKCYIHPAVIQAYGEGTLDPKLARARTDFPAAEATLLTFLESRLPADAR